jgi:hypothetical protein
LGDTVSETGASTAVPVARSVSTDSAHDVNNSDASTTARTAPRRQPLHLTQGR